ncbi:undecaprenyl-phosphate glucose phosphotransferase [Marinobacterium aestuarii]|nr:undecaprenyl-phosphate glucose phosphotransferase [Marinobacterium aestuarii]
MNAQAPITPDMRLHQSASVSLGSKASAPYRTGLTFWIHWLVATGLSTTLLCTLTWLKTDTIDSHYRVLAIIATLASVPVYTLFRVYRKSDKALSGLVPLAAAWSTLLLSLAAVALLTKTGEDYSREVLLSWAGIGFLLQAGAYIPLHSMARRYFRQQRAERRALIIGTGDLAQRLAETLVRRRHEPLIGLVAHSDEKPEFEGLYPVIGEAAHLRALIAEHDIRRLYLALPASDMELIESLYVDLLDANVDVVWIPDLASLVMLNHQVSDVGGMPAIHLNESPLTSYPTAAILKAAMDRSAALLGILALSPVLAGVALAVKLSSPGPIIFRQPRHGWNGEVIEVWKFRSMRVHQDKVVKQACREDPRITSVGAFIRRTSLDELPQLFNVLQGSMSLVGPRPHAVAHNDYYTGKIDAYMARHRIKPGITGLAQISGARGETETLDKMEKRVELDLAYINNWSLWLDIKILIKTPFTLLGKEIY